MAATVVPAVPAVPDLSSLCLRSLSSPEYDPHRVPGSLAFLPRDQAHVLSHTLPPSRWGDPGVLAQFVGSSLTSLHLPSSSAFPVDLLLAHGFLGDEVFHTSLDSLSFRGTTSLTDNGLAHLALSPWAVARLTNLDMSQCPGVTARGVALLVHLPALLRLDLSCRDLSLPTWPWATADDATSTSSSPAAPAEWPQLTHLHLLDTVITAETLRHIADGLGRSLRVLDIRQDFWTKKKPVAAWSAAANTTPGDIAPVPAVEHDCNGSDDDDDDDDDDSAAPVPWPHLHTLLSGGMPSSSRPHLPLPLAPGLRHLHLSVYREPLAHLADALAAPTLRHTLTSLYFSNFSEPFPAAMTAAVTTHLTALTKLSLIGVKLGRASFTALTRLEELDISGSQIASWPSTPSPSPSPSTSQSGGVDAETAVDGAAVSMFPSSLKVLHMHWAMWPDAKFRSPGGPLSFVHCPRLETLSLAKSFLDEPSWVAVMQGLPSLVNLTSLSLCHANVPASAVRHLAPLPSLQHLDIRADRCNPLLHIGPQAIGPYTVLQKSDFVRRFVFPADTLLGVDDLMGDLGRPSNNNAHAAAGGSAGAGPCSQDYAAFQRWWTAQLGATDDVRTIVPGALALAPAAPALPTDVLLPEGPRARFMRARTDPRAAFLPPGVKPLAGLTVAADDKGKQGIASLRTGRDLAM